MLNDKAKLVRSQTKGVDLKVDEILGSPEGSLGKLYQKVLGINKSKLKKSYVEAALITSNDFVRIAEILELPLEVVEFYSEFFFDVVDFDRLSKIEHIENISDDHKNEMLLKMWALSHGLDFIRWRLGHRVALSPVEGLVDLFSTCVYKSKEAMYNSSSSEASKEAVKWTKQSTDIARLLKMWVMDSSAAKKDLEIAIREVVPEFDGLDTLLDELALSEFGSKIEEVGSIEDEIKIEGFNV